MGHEIAHAIARHGAERMAHQKLAQLGTLAAGMALMALGDMDPQTQNMVMGALGVRAQYGVLLPFSRDHESKADYMGLVYAARACYDPTEATELWVRMGEASGGRRSLCRRTRATRRESGSSKSGCPKHCRFAGRDVAHGCAVPPCACSARSLFRVRRRFGSCRLRIGIGGSLAAPPLPHHRTCGSASGGSAV